MLDIAEFNPRIGKTTILLQRIAQLFARVVQTLGSAISQSQINPRSGLGLWASYGFFPQFNIACPNAIELCDNREKCSGGDHTYCYSAAAAAFKKRMPTNADNRAKPIPAKYVRRSLTMILSGMRA